MTTEEKRQPSPERVMKLEPDVDLVVVREQFEADSRFPKIVRERVAEMKEKDEIIKMWNDQQTTTYIPSTTQGRQMKMQAKLRARLSERQKLARNPFVIFEKPIDVDETDSKVKALALLL